MRPRRGGLGASSSPGGRGVPSKRHLARCGLRERLSVGTLPTWIARRGFALEPFGLELIPSVADLARTRLPNLAERIYTGDVTQWEPPRRWTFITALTDAVPPGGLPGLVYRLLDRFAEPGGRVIISSYGSSRRREPADAVAERLTADRFEVAGFAQAIESGIIVTQTAWIDADLRPRRVC
jgi:hypothetical protein